uniref:Uncharacterized protein n=1 Tax=Molossus molossus TaxID=27622 RepID=A0A7J8ERX9_MOLMO|nr:hypothetical protein HJG59_008755 [Molossus molossus]
MQLHWSLRPPAHTIHRHSLRLSWAWPCPPGGTGSPHTGAAVPAGRSSHTWREAETSWARTVHIGPDTVVGGLASGALEARGSLGLCPEPAFLPPHRLGATLWPSVRTCLPLRSTGAWMEPRDLVGTMHQWRADNPHPRSGSPRGGEVVDFWGLTVTLDLHFEALVGLGGLFSLRAWLQELPGQQKPAWMGWSLPACLMYT